MLHSTGLVNRLVTLEVRGRRTGRIISFPLVIADYQGERYLVAMLGQNANWVRNVRAAGGYAVLRHGRRENVHLQEIEPAARAPILRRYLACAPGARPHVPVDRHAPLEEYGRIAAQVPVFRITSQWRSPGKRDHGLQRALLRRRPGQDQSLLKTSGTPLNGTGPSRRR
ncbi:nitroreductase/quinone reductase family protein [Nonomuraea sp. 10N515B]|uniref:nitroreductase/quinone reductase family protein n=1 Tax=Nonomuraea sp. 10N515B TaxID=3457422 RepID=UPI003FCD6A3D